MNIAEYLRGKYQVQTPTSMTSIEAYHFGIPWPLKNGWLAEYGDRVITSAAYTSIKISLERRAKKKAKEKAKKGAKAAFVVKVQHAPVLKAKTVTAPSVITGDFLQSYEWRKLRMQALKLHGARCQCCGASPANGAVMNVDHIKPRRLFPWLALDLNNLQVLCGECNHGKGNWDQTDWRPKEGKIYDPLDGLNEMLKSF